MRVEHPGSADSGSTPLLNEPQRRHFEVFLSMLETALNEVEMLGSDAPPAPEESLVVQDSDLPKDFSTRAHPAVQVIRRQITSLGRTLDIKPRHISRARRVKALLTAELVRLDDTYARKLRGYGAVSPRIAAEIDPVLDRIRTEIVDLLLACERQPRDSNPATRK